jgi:thioredoxin reductase (NADPH)
VPERDVVIVGAGAAGLSAALFAALEDRDVLVLEELASGGQQLLVEAIANYPGSGPLPGYELSQRMEEQAVAAGASITNDSVSAVRLDGRRFVVEAARGEVAARSVVLCTGTEHRPLGVPGERELKGKGVSSCAACDGHFFRDGRVVVVGGGDAACDEALYLASITGGVLLLDRNDRFRAQASLARRVTQTTGVEIRHETEVMEIVGPERVTAVRLLDRASGRSYVEPVDAVFVFVGSFPRLPRVQGLKTDEGGYLVTDQKMETSIPGLFAAGAVRAGPFRQCIVAAGEGAVAGHAAALHAASLDGRGRP